MTEEPKTGVTEQGYKRRFRVIHRHDLSYTEEAVAVVEAEDEDAACELAQDLDDFVDVGERDIQCHVEAEEVEEADETTMP